MMIGSQSPANQTALSQLIHTKMAIRTTTVHQIIPRPIHILSVTMKYPPLCSSRESFN
jgi:hypothetical protein